MKIFIDLVHYETLEGMKTFTKDGIPEYPDLLSR